MVDQWVKIDKWDRIDLGCDVPVVGASPVDNDRSVC
jgi:hypothetical protein